MGKYTTVEEQVIYGLDKIDPNRWVKINVQDAVLLHQLLGELLHFFEQPKHYPDIEDIHQFMGDSEHGALKLLSKAYHQILQDILPVDIHQEFAEGEMFDHPNPPYYSIES